MDMPTCLKDILDTPSMLDDFRVFLKVRLAIENLLFYESIQLYKKLDSDEARNKCGRELVEKFVKLESLDAINVAYKTRNTLETTEMFLVDTFDVAEKEVYLLMETNFLLDFTKFLQGDNGGVDESRMMPMLMGNNVQMETLSDFALDNEEQEDFPQLFNCSCEHPDMKSRPSDNDKHFCCENGRAKDKVKKKGWVLSKLKKTFLSRRKHNSSASFFGMRQPTTARSMSMWKDLNLNL